ncbi:MAG: hypothetical protein WAT09_02335 [Paracoccaceae bacterium]
MNGSDALKLSVARAQLGTALSLFIRDEDPVSVHTLACSACELLADMAVVRGVKSVSLYVSQDYTRQEIAGARGLYWNAFKHFFENDRKAERDDSSIKTRFSDETNDWVLFQGWSDLAQFGRPTPVEGQVLTLWFFAQYPELNAPNLFAAGQSLFPFTSETSRAERKRALALVCAEWKKNPDLLKDLKTDLEPLVASGASQTA